MTSTERLMVTWSTKANDCEAQGDPSSIIYRAVANELAEALTKDYARTGNDATKNEAASAEEVGPPLNLGEAVQAVFNAAGVIVDASTDESDGSITLGDLRIAEVWQLREALRAAAKAKPPEFQLSLYKHPGRIVAMFSVNGNPPFEIQGYRLKVDDDYCGTLESWRPKKEGRASIESATSADASPESPPAKATTEEDPVTDEAEALKVRYVVKPEKESGW